MKTTPVVQLFDYEAAAEFFDVPNGMFTADVKRFEADLRRNDPSKPVYVAVVETTRHCGGAEEGGWYYDWNQVVEIVECEDGFRNLLVTVKALRESHPTCPRGRHSVIGGADVTIYMTRNEKLIDSLQSKETPRYE